MDRFEAALVTGTVHAVPQALKQSVDNSRELVWTVVVHGTPAGVGGIAKHPTRPEMGCPWMVATPDIYSAVRPFLRASREWMKLASPAFRTLVNFVHVDNEDSKRWLEWLGFSILPAVPYGASRAYFHPFMRHNPCV